MVGRRVGAGVGVGVGVGTGVCVGVDVGAGGTVGAAVGRATATAVGAVRRVGSCATACGGVAVAIELGGGAISVGTELLVEVPVGSCAGGGFGWTRGGGVAVGFVVGVSGCTAGETPGGSPTVLVIGVSWRGCFSSPHAPTMAARAALAVLAISILRE